ncbi:MAG: TonB family protein [candidate division WOR-3 bacterium]|nr:MAG: TonB family protein [candidate division WOR-3 bacterium]
MRRLLVIWTLIMLCLISCKGKGEKFLGEQGGSLTIGTMDMPTRLSPLEPSVFSSDEIMNLLFLRLHEIDRNTGKMRPVLAESWEFSEDLKSITYYLRKGVEWWDGQPVTAHDVLYTYEQMKDPENNYANISMLRFISKVEVLNDYAVMFTFDKVYADILTDSDIMPVPKHLHEQLGHQFSISPIGNGPYRIKEWVRGSEIILEANDGYYGGRPPLDEIHIKQFRNIDQMLNDFADGGLEMIFGIPPSTADALSGNDNVSIYSRPGNSYLYVGWNLTHTFLGEGPVRRALAMAIDRQRILRELYGGMGEISLGPLPPSSWGYNAEIQPIPYDVEGARTLLRDNGFVDYNRNGIIDKDRRDFTIRIVTNSENADRVAILRYVSDDLRKIGIRVTVQTLQAEDFVTALLNRQFDGFVMGWRVGEKIDPTLYWHSRGRYNLVSYSNGKVDSLIDAGISMLDRKKARAVWNEFQQIVYDEQPYFFLVVPHNIAATYKRVKGVDREVRLASATEYWIPETERRVSVTAVMPEIERAAEGTSTVGSQPVGVDTTVTTTEEASSVIAPEMILEAAAQSDTAVADTGSTSLIAALPPAPPKPSVIARAEAVKRIQPKYPAAALEFAASGTVVVRVLVGVDGLVKDAVIIKSFGNPACEQAALNAARQWEFTPATKDGAPFEQRVSIPFTFTPD